MLSLILKDKGSIKHSKITDEDFADAKKELDAMKGNQQEMLKMTNELIEMVKQYAQDFEWFDVNAILNSKKENLGKYIWLIAQSYQIRLEKEKIADKYGFDISLNLTKKEDEKFDKYFKKREAIGIRFFYEWSYSWTIVFSKGFQFFRLIVGPFMWLLSKIPYVALFSFLFLWIPSALFDWLIFGLPYMIIRMASGLSGDYYDSEMLIGSYLFGNCQSIKNETRELVKNDSANSDAYLATLWGIFMREKLVEIVRREREK